MSDRVCGPKQQGHREMETVLTRLDRNAARGGADWHFPAERRTLSMVELRDRSLRLATVMRDCGVTGGARVALMMNTSSHYVLALLALWRLGATAVPLPAPGPRPKHHAEYIRRCDAACSFQLMLCDDTVTGATCSPLFTNRFHARIKDLIKAAAHAPAQPVQAAGKAAHGAVLQCSQDSSGKLSCVSVSHSMMMVRLEHISRTHRKARRGRPVESLASWLPFDHDMGLFCGVLMPLFTGCRNLLVSPACYRQQPLHWFAQMSARRVDMHITTPSALAAALAVLGRLRPSASTMELSRLHLYLYADKASPPVLRHCYRVLEPLGFKREHLHAGFGVAENAVEDNRPPRPGRRPLPEVTARPPIAGRLS
ncbi:MAG TPA: hypothetical protein ENJ19_04215 [Gammaproteobacteria bacterium]|nr:hypothetical protein [Gammaproteobacteria bacterium]